MKILDILKIPVAPTLTDKQLREVVRLIGQLARAKSNGNKLGFVSAYDKLMEYRPYFKAGQNLVEKLRGPNKWR